MVVYAAVTAQSLLRKVIFYAIFKTQAVVLYGIGNTKRCLLGLIKRLLEFF